MTYPLIQAHNLTRHHAQSDRLLLDHVNLTICAGERIGLVGPSGSGKSTLLRAIARLDRCRGEVRYRGMLVQTDAVPAYRRQVVYLTQRPAFVSGTVRTNLELPFRLTASQRPYDEATVMRWLDRLEKPISFLDQATDSLSGGEQQMVALVRALSLQPTVLLLDEPTASLDAESTSRFEALIITWLGDPLESATTQRALVWTSHDVGQVRRMTTRTVHMKNGKLSSGDTDE